MKLTTRGRYALRVMIDIALYCADDFVPLKDIAKRQNISVKYLEHIIAQLRTTGLLHGSRGMYGGYKLTKKPEEYAIGEILRATEGEFATAEITPSAPGTDGNRARDIDQSFWLELDYRVRRFTESITLKDLIDSKNNDENDNIEDSVQKAGNKTKPWPAELEPSIGSYKTPFM